MPAEPTRKLPPKVIRTDRSGIGGPDGGSSSVEMFRHTGYAPTGAGGWYPEATHAGSVHFQHENPQSTYFYERDRGPNKEPGIHYDGSRRTHLRQQAEREYDSERRHGGQMRLFGSAHDPGRTEVTDLSVSREARPHAMTLVGMAKVEADKRGNELVPSDNLSRHSAPMVERLNALHGTSHPTPQSPYEFNDVTFAPEARYSQPRERAGEWDLKEGGREISTGEWNAARKAGREMVRKPRQPTPESVPVHIQGRMFHDTPRGRIYPPSVET